MGLMADLHLVIQPSQVFRGTDYIPEKCMTQKQIIVRYLESCNGWRPAYTLRGLNTPFGFLGHQADRRARELAAEGKLQHKIEGGYAWYRATPLQYKTLFVRGDHGEVIQTINLPI